MNLAHKIRIYPNRAQEQDLIKACGVARFTYNWILGEWSRQYKAGEKPTANKLKKQWNSYKKDLFPWVYESPKDCNQQPIINLGNSFRKFFKKQSNYPQQKKKGICDSFYISNDKANIVDDRWIRLPLIGQIRLAEKPRFAAKILSYSVSKDVDRWFVSIAYELPTPSIKIQNCEVTGIDLGLKDFAVLSDGTRIENPKFLKRLEKRLVRAQRQLAKKQKGSQNRKKARIRVAKIHQRIRDQKSDFIHKFTTNLAKTKQEIVMEDLNVSGMLKNHKLAQSIANVSWAEFRRQLEYKTKRYGSLLTVVDRFYPSSKTCSNCSFKIEKLDLSVRSWVCPNCSTKQDRDINAALNLRLQAKSVGKAIPEFKPVEFPLSGGLEINPRYDSMKQEFYKTNVTSVHI